MNSADLPNSYECRGCEKDVRAVYVAETLRCPVCGVSMGASIEDASDAEVRAAINQHEERSA